MAIGYGEVGLFCYFFRYKNLLPCVKSLGAAEMAVCDATASGEPDEC